MASLALPIFSGSTDYGLSDAAPGSGGNVGSNWTGIIDTLINTGGQLGSAVLTGSSSIPVPGAATATPASQPASTSASLFSGGTLLLLAAVAVVFFIVRH